MRRLLPLALLLLAVAPAHARTLAHGTRLDALRLGGGGVLLERRAGEVMRFAPDAPPEQVVEGEAKGGPCDDPVRFDASVTHVVVTCARLALAGRIGAEPGVVGDCQPLRALALDRSLLAAVCGNAVTVRDLAEPAGGVRSFPLPANALSPKVRIGGGRLALVTGIPGATVQLTVTDLASGDVVTRYASDILDFDLGEDGTLALLRRDRATACGAVLLLAHPGQAAPIGVVGCAYPFGVRVAGGRVAYVGRDGGDEALTTFDALTGARRVLARLQTGIAIGALDHEVDQLDFDGRSMAYAVPSCEGDRDLELVAADATPGPRLAAACPISLHVRGDRATLACPVGCATARLTAFDARSRPLRSTRGRALRLPRATRRVRATVAGRDGVRRSQTVNR